MADVGLAGDGSRDECRATFLEEGDGSLRFSDQPVSLADSTPKKFDHRLLLVTWRDRYPKVYGVSDIELLLGSAVLNDFNL